MPDSWGVSKQARRGAAWSPPGTFRPRQAEHRPAPQARPGGSAWRLARWCLRACAGEFIGTRKWRGPRRLLAGEPSRYLPLVGRSPGHDSSTVAAGHLVTLAPCLRQALRCAIESRALYPAGALHSLSGAERGRALLPTVAQDGASAGARPEP
jgi:hypothetical protein